MNKYSEIQNAIDEKVELESFEDDIIGSLIDEVTPIFQKEEQVIEISEDDSVVFIGDTHGDFISTVNVIKKYLLETDSKLVFIGDYVDKSLERFGDVKNIVYLIYFKLKFPKRVILLRGNHEEADVNSYGGFRSNVEALWSKKIWQKFSYMFLQMPLVAVTKEIIALHGGLPKINSLDDINKIPKGTTGTDHSIVQQILWNDIHKSDEGLDVGENRGRKYSFVHGKIFFEEIMNKIGKKLLIKGHFQYSKGFLFDKRCLTIFTSKMYEDFPNDNELVDIPIKGIFVAIKYSNESYKDIKIEHL